MADNKPERKKSPLYDRGSDKDVRSKESGKPAAKDAGKMAEPKGKGHDGERAPEGGAPTHERHAEERTAMHRRHETERRDMHGNHREEHRKMASRHEKEHKDLMAKHEGEMTAEAGPTDGLQAGGEAAMGGQAPAAGGEPTVQATEAA
jgi:hypothetical protein